MQTILDKPELKEITPASFGLSSASRMVEFGTSSRLKIKEFAAWSVCFAIVAGLTGMLKIAGLGITMSPVTNGLFYLSGLALVYFIARIILLSRTASTVVPNTRLQELN